MSNSEESPIRQSPVPLDKCGAARALDVLPDRATWLVIRSLGYGVGRFADIQAETGIPKSVLSDRLRKIVDHGLATKRDYRDGAARTRQEYVLTGAGRGLVPVILALMHWGDQHLKDGESALALTDRRTGNALRVALVPEGKAIPLRRLTLTAVWDKAEKADG